MKLQVFALLLSLALALKTVWGSGSSVFYHHNYAPLNFHSVPVVPTYFNYYPVVADGGTRGERRRNKEAKHSEEYPEHSRPFYQSPTFLVFALVIVLGGGVIGFLVWQSNKQEKQDEAVCECCVTINYKAIMAQPSCEQCHSILRLEL